MAIFNEKTLQGVFLVVKNFAIFEACSFVNLIVLIFEEQLWIGSHRWKNLCIRRQWLNRIRKVHFMKAQWSIRDGFTVLQVH
jgi:hypothetical protein